MPFGINLPGPFTFSAQDKSSKKLLKMQQRKGMGDQLEDMANRMQEKASDLEDQLMIRIFGTEKFTDEMTEIKRLEGLSKALADQRRADLKEDAMSYLVGLATGKGPDGFKEQFGHRPKGPQIHMWNKACKRAKKAAK